MNEQQTVWLFFVFINYQDVREVSFRRTFHYGLNGGVVTIQRHRIGNNPAQLPAKYSGFLQRLLRVSYKDFRFVRVLIILTKFVVFYVFLDQLIAFFFYVNYCCFIFFPQTFNCMRLLFGGAFPFALLLRLLFRL